jgi:hypothetical protein
MTQAISDSIHVTVRPIVGGGWASQATTSLLGTVVSARRFHGQTAAHAVALALEDLARAFRSRAEAEQAVDWETVYRSPSGEVVYRHFHVTLHYEVVAEEESKFEALNNTLLGNTVVENAEIAIVEVDPGLPRPEWTPRGGG